LRRDCYTSEILIDVTDVKQYFFCPRIVYFNHVLGYYERTTESEVEGKEVHEELWNKEKRRKTILKKRSLSGYEKIFGLRLYSRRLRLKGILDCLAYKDKEYIPIEYKETNYPGYIPANHKYQLVAYSLLVDETYNTITRYGYIYYSKSDKLAKVKLTIDMKRYVRESVDKIINIIINEYLPPVRTRKSRCINCGYYKICQRV